MPPRSLLACFLATTGAAPLAAQAPAAGRPPAEAFVVLDPRPEPGPRVTPFLRHQLDRAWAQDDGRRAAWEAVRTEADLRRLQAETRRRLLAVLGGLPAEKTSLNARITGTIAMEGYRIEKVVFESLPGLFVTALVYLPDEPKGAMPAVLLACGHAPLGKAYAWPGAATSSSAGTRSARVSAASSGTRPGGAAATTWSAASTPSSATSRCSRASAWPVG
jgi:hypothetical protein